MAHARQVYLMVILVMALASSCVGYGAWDALRAGEAEERQTADAATVGAERFANFCRACHGRGGGGGVAPALDRPDLRPDDPIKLAAMQAFITSTLKCGRGGTLMPALSIIEGGPFTEEQIRQLVVLITVNPELAPTGLGAHYPRGRETAWERAKGLADDFDDTGRRLAQAASPSDTMLIVSSPLDMKEGDFFRLDDEVLEIVKADGTSIQVKRGAKGRQPAGHAEGSRVFLPPLDPPTAPSAPACGQIVKAAPTPVAPPPAATPPPGPTASFTVNAGDNFFEETSLVAAVNQQVTVTMANKGKSIHNLHLYTADPAAGGKELAAKPVVTDPFTISGGAQGSVTFTIDNPGTYFYQCDFHIKDMRGALFIVEP